MKYLIAVALFCFCQVINAQSSAYNASQSNAEQAVDNLRTSLTYLKNNLTINLRNTHNNWQTAQRGNASVVQNYQNYLQNCAAKKNKTIPSSFYSPINLCVNPDAGNFVSNFTGNLINSTIDTNIYMADRLLSFCRKRVFEAIGIICFRGISIGSPVSSGVATRTSNSAYVFGSYGLNSLRAAIFPCVTNANATLTRELQRINIDPSKC